MKFKKTKAAALSLAAIIACGSLAGCTLVTTDPAVDLAQSVATIDISKSAVFENEEAYKPYKQYLGGIEESYVLKSELVANYSSIGPTYISYGYTAEQVYDLIRESLINRQIFLQYARMYFYEQSAKGEIEGTYTESGYNAAIAGKEGTEKIIAGLAYFLDPDEIAIAEYTVKYNLNATLDSQETEVIESLENHNHEHNHDDESTTSSGRTTPTGVDTTNEDFYDPAYQIYTGTNSASACGTYETIDESTPTTRRTAYKNFLANLGNYGLVGKEENTGDITSLNYYQYQRKSQYESAVISKLEDALEEEANKNVSEEWIRTEKFEKTLETQKKKFDSDTASLESALDSVSDSNYVFYAPDAYGFVINILLPFSTLQSQELTDSPADSSMSGDDDFGNKFMTRAALLRDLTATDQRTDWFDSDYAFEAQASDKAYTGGSDARNYLFFENNLNKSSVEEGEAQYEPLKNYYGKYTFNGKVLKTENEDGDTEYAFRPNKLTIDGFLAEMESYLNFAGLDLTGKTYNNGEGSAYYDRDWTEYYKEQNGAKVVDYSKFLYYTANISQLSSFDANKIFLKGSTENTAFSVINELSFAYNTDTAGLNSYLGYAVTPNNTEFVKEFEYAAQVAVRGGAGTITVAPSEFGWHIMFCTFSYAGNATPYEFNWDEIEVEGTFSNLYYEALRAENLSSFSTDRRSTIINSFDNDTCVTVYEKRWQNLIET